MGLIPFKLKCIVCEEKIGFDYFRIENNGDRCICGKCYRNYENRTVKSKIWITWW